MLDLKERGLRCNRQKESSIFLRIYEKKGFSARSASFEALRCAGHCMKKLWVKR